MELSIYEIENAMQELAKEYSDHEDNIDNYLECLFYEKNRDFYGMLSYLKTNYDFEPVDKSQEGEVIDDILENLEVVTYWGYHLKSSVIDSFNTGEEEHFIPIENLAERLEVKKDFLASQLTRWGFLMQDDCVLQIHDTEGLCVEPKNRKDLETLLDKYRGVIMHKLVKEENKQWN